MFPCYNSYMNLDVEFGIIAAPKQLMIWLISFLSVLRIA